MSVACRVCQQYHDHNIMEHIYELEARIAMLVARLDELDKSEETQ